MCHFPEVSIFIIIWLYNIKYIFTKLVEILEFVMSELKVVLSEFDRNNVHAVPGIATCTTCSDARLMIIILGIHHITYISMQAQTQTWLIHSITHSFINKVTFAGFT